MKIIKMQSHFLERIKKISENDFLDFSFLNVNIFLTIHRFNMKLYRYNKNIVVDTPVSQIFDIDPIFLY